MPVEEKEKEKNIHRITNVEGSVQYLAIKDSKELFNLLMPGCNFEEFDPELFESSLSPQELESYKNYLAKGKEEDALQTESYQKIAAKITVFIKRYCLENGYSPTIGEITVMLGFKSTNSANYWLSRMKKLGHLDFQPRVARSFRIPGLSYQYDESLAYFTEEDLDNEEGGV